MCGWWPTNLIPHSAHYRLRAPTIHVSNRGTLKIYRSVYFSLRRAGKGKPIACGLGLFGNTSTMGTPVPRALSASILDRTYLWVVFTELQSHGQYYANSDIAYVVSATDKYLPFNSHPGIRETLKVEMVLLCPESGRWSYRQYHFPHIN